MYSVSLLEDLSIAFLAYTIFQSLQGLGIRIKDSTFVSSWEYSYGHFKEILLPCLGSLSYIQVFLSLDKFSSFLVYTSKE